MASFNRIFFLLFSKREACCVIYVLICSYSYFYENTIYRYISDRSMCVASLYNMILGISILYILLQTIFRLVRLATPDLEIISDIMRGDRMTLVHELIEDIRPPVDEQSVLKEVNSKMIAFERQFQWEPVRILALHMMKFLLIMSLLAWIGIASTSYFKIYNASLPICGLDVDLCNKTYNFMDFFYFAVATSVTLGTGDMKPNSNDFAHIYIILLSCISMFFLIIGISYMTSTIFQKPDRVRQLLMDNLNYLRLRGNNGIPPSL